MTEKKTMRIVWERGKAPPLAWKQEAMCQGEKTYKDQVKEVNSERLKFHYFVFDNIKIFSFRYS